MVSAVPVKMFGWMQEFVESSDEARRPHCHPNHAVIAAAAGAGAAAAGAGGAAADTHPLLQPPPPPVRAPHAASGVPALLWSPLRHGARSVAINAMYLTMVRWGAR